MIITTRKFISTIVLLVIIAGGAFFYGLHLGGKGYVFTPHDFKIVNQNTSTQTVDYSLLWQALDILNTKYIDKPLDQQKLLYGAVSGMVAAAGDPYTTFFDPKSYSDFQTQLSGTFEGIGAEVGIKDNQIVVVAPIDGTPAKAAGLQPGDVILKINGTDTTGMSLDTAVSMIRGPKGSQVKLSIGRANLNSPLELTITRQTISIASVKHSIQMDNGKPVEVITLSEFGDDTVDLFHEAALEAQSKKAQGIIVDLRNDPGGYLDDAVTIASYWVPKDKLVVAEAHSDGTTKNYTATGNNIFASIPTVVLINGGSASAAEILTGALHDYGYAKTVGEKSFGKGSVQELTPLPNNTAIKVTVAKWLTPNGININHNGLDPDVAVTATPDQVKANQDPQMDKALELLK